MSRARRSYSVRIRSSRPCTSGRFLLLHQEGSTERVDGSTLYHFERLFLVRWQITDHCSEFPIVHAWHLIYLLQEHIYCSHAFSQTLNDQKLYIGCKLRCRHITHSYPVQCFLDYLSFTHREVRLEHRVKSTYTATIQCIEH